MALAPGRAALEGDRTLVGRSLCRAYSDLVDGWLAELVADAEAECGAGGVALVAVGGYGRAELSLQSDIDVVLLHTGRSDIGTLADRIWYPIWDEGLKLGHAVRTAPRGPGAGRRRPRHRDLAAAGAPPRRRRRSHRRPRPPVPRAVAEAVQAMARGALAAGAEPPRGRRRGGLPPRAGPEGGARRPARRPRPALGRGGSSASSGRATTPCSTRPTTPCSRPGWSSTAAPADPVTGCCSRSRTPWRRRCTTSRPTPSCTGWRRPPARSPGAATTPGSGSTPR